jgi:hypothetical protein
MCCSDFDSPAGRPEQHISHDGGAFASSAWRLRTRHRPVEVAQELHPRTRRSAADVLVSSLAAARVLPVDQEAVGDLAVLASVWYHVCDLTAVLECFAHQPASRDRFIVGMCVKRH